MASDPVTVFFSYSHVDEALRDELAKHLSILKHNGVIADWHDRQILPGDEWDGVIKDNLNSAQIILLLISADFIASRYCNEVEIARAMERHEARDACVIPVILRPCDWRDGPFGKLQALPKNGNAVTSNKWHTFDEAFTDIAEGIKKAARTIRQNSQPDEPNRPLNIYEPINHPTYHQPLVKKAPRPDYGKSLLTFLKKTLFFQVGVIIIWLIAALSLNGVVPRDYIYLLSISGAMAGISSGLLEGLALSLLKIINRKEEVFLKYPLVGLIIGGLGWVFIGTIVGNNAMTGSNGYWFGLVSGIVVVLLTFFYYAKLSKSSS
jgi:hypothetical protein